MVTIIGYVKSDFTIDGRSFQGYRVFVTEPISANGSGSSSFGFWLRDDVFKASGITVGAKANVYWNRFRKVDKVEVIK